MWRNKAQLLVAVASIGVGVIVLACSAPASPEATGAPADDAATLVEERCSRCHNLAGIEGASKTREEWQRTVTRMIEKGAELSADEQEVVVDYLAEIAGP
jgi:hypothetical protein